MLFYTGLPSLGTTLAQGSWSKNKFTISTATKCFWRLVCRTRCPESRHPTKNYYCIRYNTTQKKGPTPEEREEEAENATEPPSLEAAHDWPPPEKKVEGIFLIAWNLAHSGQVSCKCPAATWCSSFQSICIFRVRILVPPSKWLFGSNTKHTVLLHSLPKAKGTQHLRKNLKSPSAVNQRKGSNAHPEADSFDVNMNYDTCITYKGSYNFYDEYYVHRLSVLKDTKGY